jgi:tyrosyl-tRNA synthetase
MEGVPTLSIDKTALEAGYDLVSYLAESGIFPSKGEARKMWQSGGISLNKNKIGADKTLLQATDLLNDKYLLIQKGRKNYYLVIAG